MRRTRGYTRRLLLLGLLFSGLAVAFTWPLALHMRTHVIGPFQADNLEYVWKIWWVKHAFLDLHRSPLVQPDIYYPFGYLLAYGEITPLHTYLGIPLTALLGPVATYNVFIVAATALTGLCTCLFAWELLGSLSAGVVAGIIFALCPYRMARNAGHLPLVGTYWVPLMFLSIERFIGSRKPTFALLAGGCFAGSTLSSWYYGLALAVLLPPYLVLRARRVWQWGDLGEWVRGGLCFAATACILVVPFLLPYRTLFQEGMAGVPLEQAAFWSASFTDYLIPNPLHFLWGQWVQRHLLFQWQEVPYEFIVGWGFLPSLLALWGWVWARGKLGTGWAWWVGASCVLSLGPAAKLFGSTVDVPLGDRLTGAVTGVLSWLGVHSFAGEPYTLAGAGRMAIPLPALILRWFVPGLTGMRAWGRFAVLAVFGIAVAASAGMSVLLETYRARAIPGRRACRGVLAPLAVMGCLLFTLYTGPQQLIAVGPRPVDVWLATRAGQVTVIQMPLSVALSGPQMFYTMYHRQRVASGYGTYLPILFERWHPELREFPSDRALDALERWGNEGVDLVLVDTNDVPQGDPLWGRIADQERLQEVVTAGTVKVYDIR